MATKSKTTIELNGKLYDARTGAIISDSTPKNTPEKVVSVSSKPKTAPKPVKQPALQNKVVDGFVRPAQTKVAQKPKPIAQPETPNTSSSKPEIAKSKAIQHGRRKTEKSKTLMRPAVKKPKIERNQGPHTQKTPKVTLTNAERTARAKNHSKSPLINKFGVHPHSTVQKKQAHLPVVEQNIIQKAEQVAANELHQIEKALENANSHLHQLEEEVVEKLPFLQRYGFRSRVANFAMISFACLLLVGFFGYQNYNAMAMQYASSRAGINAEIPSYKPAGFNVGNIDFAPGRVSVSFDSRTDDRGFTLSQEASAWNSTSLLANFVTKNNCKDCYETWQNEGKTVYTFDNNATWVSGGVWYLLESDADLTSDQILRLASSL